MRTLAAGDTLLIGGNYLWPTADHFPETCCLFCLSLPMMHCVLLHFLLLVYNLVHFAFTPQTKNTGVHLEANWHLCFQADWVQMSFYTTQNEPDYPRKRTRVCLKGIKQLWYESDLIGYFAEDCRTCSVESEVVRIRSSRDSFQLQDQLVETLCFSLWFLLFMGILCVHADLHFRVSRKLLFVHMYLYVHVFVMCKPKKWTNHDLMLQKRVRD